METNLKALFEEMGPSAAQVQRMYRNISEKAEAAPRARRGRLKSMAAAACCLVLVVAVAVPFGLNQSGESGDSAQAPQNGALYGGFVMRVSAAEWEGDTSASESKGGAPNEQVLDLKPDTETLLPYHYNILWSTVSGIPFSFSFGDEEAAKSAGATLMLSAERGSFHSRNVETGEITKLGGTIEDLPEGELVYWSPFEGGNLSYVPVDVTITVTAIAGGEETARQSICITSNEAGDYYAKLTEFVEG